MGEKRRVGHGLCKQEPVINSVASGPLSRGQAMLDSIRALEFYCGIGKVSRPSTVILSTYGIGGLHCALSRSSVGNNATVVRAFDWDQLACAVYTANHGPGIAHSVRVKLFALGL